MGRRGEPGPHWPEREEAGGDPSPLLGKPIPLSSLPPCRSEARAFPLPKEAPESAEARSRDGKSCRPGSANTDLALLRPHKHHCHRPFPILRQRSGGRLCKESRAEGEMHWGVPFGALLALLSGLSGPVWGEKGEIEVSILGSNVSLNCQKTEATWVYGKGTNFSNPLTLVGENGLEEGKEFTCQGGGQSRKIYLKVKVCEDCVELSLGLVAGIIISDLLVTLGVLCMVYFCCKNRVAPFRSAAGGGGAHRRQRGQKGDSPPPVPNPDYEPIRKGQREVYAGLGPRAY